MTSPRTILMADKTAEIEKLTIAIDKASARSAQLKEEVARLQKELADLAASQAEMDKLRSQENADYKQNRADMEQGLAGVKLALKVLREYYTKADKVEKAAKDQDVKYKIKESQDLDKAVTEDSADRSGVQTELDAVNEYLDSLHKQCDETVEPYAERKRRREAEIAGLKEALTILEGQASLVQTEARHALRGVQIHRSFA